VERDDRGRTSQFPQSSTAAADPRTEGTSTPLPATYVHLGVRRESRFENQLRGIFGARLAIRLMTLLLKAAIVAGCRSRGRLVLLDHHTVDDDLPSDALDRKNRLSAKLVRRTNAQPDPMRPLDAPVEGMYARKGEREITELQLRRDAYLGMAKRMPHMATIDAQQARDEVRRQATEPLRQRWSPRNGSTHQAVPARGATVISSSTVSGRAW
jgi:hypothetical protein